MAMHEKQGHSVPITCQCGKVAFRASGSPILVASCYCRSCQQAGQDFENSPSASPVRDADGGTPYLLYRKDRVRCETGREHLEEIRLKPDSPTRRLLATCCNSPMLLDFTRGHWLSIYRKRVLADAPPLEMRIMTKERPAGPALPNDVPNYASHSGNGILKLMLAWAAMEFRKPDLGLALRRRGDA